MVSRTGSTKDVLVTGHGDASIGPAGTALDIQTWGTSLTLESKVAMKTECPDFGHPDRFPGSAYRGWCRYFGVAELYGSALSRSVGRVGM